jgi:cyanate permease
MATPKHWEVIESSDSQTDTPSEKTTEDHGAAFSALMLALKALSQRAFVALLDLFCLVSFTGVWFLWYSTPEPTINQIISLSIFALFALAANLIVRRK